MTLCGDCARRACEPTTARGDRTTCRTCKRVLHANLSWLRATACDRERPASKRVVTMGTCMFGRGKPGWGSSASDAQTPGELGVCFAARCNLSHGTRVER